MADMFLPISVLSAYQQDWTIRARVTAKGAIRSFNKNAGQGGKTQGGTGGGKVFSLQLLDAEGGEIQAMFFNEAAEEWFPKLAKGTVYTFSKGNVRVANRQFNTCKHRYEIMFDKSVQVVELGECKDIEEVKFTFSDIKSCQTRDVPFSVDLCGIVIACGPVVQFTSKAGAELVKRDLIIADDSACSIGITMWGDRAKQDDKMFTGDRLLALKGVLVKEWHGGRTGSLGEAGALQFDPTMPEAMKVQHWWTKGGADQDLTSLSVLREDGQGRANKGESVDLIDMRKRADCVNADTPEFFSVTCRLALVQTRKQGEAMPLYYQACQEPREGTGFPCNRRVDVSGFCAACNRAGLSAPRLNVRCRYADYGDSCWLQTFHDPAQVVLGLTSDEAADMEKGDAGREGLEAAVRSNFFTDPMRVTVRAKRDFFNGESRTNVTVTDAHRVSRSKHGHQLLREIQELLLARTA